KNLNFSPDEVAVYVTKWFAGFECLQDSAAQFSEILSLLTGGHIGLCVTTVCELNEVYTSRVQNGCVPSSAQECFRMLELGSMEGSRDCQLFYALISSRAEVWLKMLEEGELDVLVSKPGAHNSRPVYSNTSSSPN
ncbi:hypothetical protein JG687_00011901, partial [Phytophthora cactorum]